MNKKTISAKSDGSQIHFDTLYNKNEPGEFSACKHYSQKSFYHAT